MPGTTIVQPTMWTQRARTLAYFVLALLVAASIGMLSARSAHAATFTVNSTADPGTGVCDATECTLREAITAANDNDNDPTVDLINFAIPGAGPHTISSTSALPPITEAVTINGYSESLGEPTPATANTQAIGNNAALKIELRGPGEQSGVTGLKIEVANCTVKGLVINGWDNGVFLNINATDNQIMGNFIGTNVAGDAKVGNNGGVVALGDNNTIGGATAAARNIISGNGAGVQIGSAMGGNRVQGNYIGTRADGTGPLGNTNGVVIDGSPNNTIGGTTGGARNVISGNTTFGIRIAFNGAALNEVQGNYIGINAAGDTTLGNGNDGVSIQADADNNTIGGTTAGAGNIISGNGSDGVEVRFESGVDTDAAAGNRILSNSIYDNDALGIDLIHSNDPAGVTLNDGGDSDGGNPDAVPPDPATAPNRLQNFPVITSAKLTTRRIGGHRRKVTVIKGTLNSQPGKTYNLQFFGSPEADDSGFGEGKTFLGQKSVTTNSSGDASFTFTSRKKVPREQVVTATATRKSTGDTSEFSQAVTVS